MEFTRRKQPQWSGYQASQAPEFRIFNSLTRQKDVFRPIDGKQVKFYICGPTVYDSAHMGHARSYLCFDIIRRVMSQYFNYDVLYVMNITDIDDKIIKRARQNHLMDEYAKKNKTDLYVVMNDVIKSLDLFRQKVEVETDPDKKKMLTEMLNKVHKSSIEVEARISKKDQSLALEDQCQLILENSKDVLSEWLDKQFGDTVNDQSIFAKHAKFYENDFLQDMKDLNVLPPSVLTRVSEYIPEIIEYVERILKNGYAYTTNDGSVYFDTAKFQAKDDHFYAKLVPEAYGDTENAAKHMKESEGELSMGVDRLQEKKNPSDFALWKASKPGEPFWPSPWGNGRPGWHIECSAMSSSVCGDKLDIHGGGFDLKFPHHDNEIAQCEAYFDNPHWVNFFLHCGTLRIAGSKMSKSLKNFISIKQTLVQFTARQLRILFLMSMWNDVLDYSPVNMERACQFERVTKDFFLLVKDLARKRATACTDEASTFSKFGPVELEVLGKVNGLKAEIHGALCDSIDTPTVLERIRKLIQIGNQYVTDTEKTDTTNVELLWSIAEYLTRLLKIFGVIPESASIGYPTEGSETEAGNKEDVLMPYLSALSDFRQQVREMARVAKNSDILNECDKIRDDVLPKLGVRFEDRTNQTCIKLEDPQTLIREVEQKRAVAAQKEEEKRKRLEAAALKAEKKAAENRIPPEEWFVRGPETGKFSQFDDRGIPTHTAAGEEVSKKQRAKLEKIWATQQKAYKSTLNQANDVGADNGTEKVN